MQVAVFHALEFKITERPVNYCKIVNNVMFVTTCICFPLSFRIPFRNVGFFIYCEPFIRQQSMALKSILIH